MANQPIPAAIYRKASTAKKSNAEIEQRQEVEAAIRSTAVLKCPKELSPIAKEEWKRLINLYKKMEVNILSDLDIGSLTVYCEAFAIYTKAQRQWFEIGDVATLDTKKQKKINTIFSIMEKQSQIMYRFSEQLCLSPLGRAKMGMAFKPKQSELEKMIEDDD